MASASQSLEARELSLVGKVEMRIALADSDERLENILNTYLPPLLLKLASECVAVRNKVISICQHINTRVKPRSIKLPVAALVEQFKAHPNTPLIRHFDLLYIQQGVRRLSPPESEALFPLVVQGIAASSSSSHVHGAQLFNLLLQVLEYFRLPTRATREDLDLRISLKLSDEDAAYLKTWFGNLLLFTVVKTPKAGSETTGVSCPGLTLDEYAFLTLQHKQDTWNPSSPLGLNLADTKVRAAKLLSSGLFNDSERFLPALFAAADTAPAISGIGEDTLKRVVPNVSLEDPQLVAHLFSLYFGDDSPTGRKRVRPPLRLRILGLLTRSIKSTSFSNEIIRLVNDGIVDSSAEPTGETSVLGREAAKLRAAIFAYVNFAARHGSRDSLYSIAPRVLGRLRDFIEGQGWPRSGNNEDLVSRGYAYEIIGLLGKAGPSNLIAEPNLDVLHWLFESLALDTSSNSITVSIEESMSSIIGALAKALDPNTGANLENLLVDQMERSDKSQQDTSQKRRSTRYVAVRFANRCLPYTSTKARWINLLAVGAGTGDRPEVSEEGRRGLSPYYYRMLNGANDAQNSDSEFNFPKFVDLIQYMFYQTTTPGHLVLDKTPMAEVVLRLRKTHPGTFVEALMFSWNIFIGEALQDSPVQIKLDSDWERKLETAAENDESARNAIRKHIRSSAADPGVSTQTQLLMLAFSYTFLTSERNLSARRGDSEKVFVQFCGLSPDNLVAIVAPLYGDLEPVIFSNTHSERQNAAHMFGLLASHPTIQNANNSAVERTVDSLLKTADTWREAVGAGANRVHGSMLALAFYFSRLVFRNKLTLVLGEGFEAYLRTIVEALQSSSDSLVKEACVSSFGELCLYQVLKPTHFSDREKYKMVIDKTADLAKSGNEKGALSLGQMAMILDESNDENEDRSLLTHLEERLHKLHEIRQAESHFSIGEALTYVACGWDSKALATKLDLDGSCPHGPSREKTLVGLLAKTLGDCQNTKPALRKASVIWLLCLVQFCGHLPPVQERLSNCQAAFKRCLTDRDELIQETASRGLGLVYEKGSRQIKDDLVRDLVGSFSSENNAQLSGNVSEETQLFEPGALPTGEGSVTTYKDIMSLASEVGDSSLVYRFMSLASSNAIWSSRAAFGRFGLSGVLSDSSVDGYLADNPKLYPKLYRYRFDPNSKVQVSMNEIWNALVKDSGTTIEKHFDAIMEDLLQSILGKEWRVRQASCAAIADLVQSRPLQKYEEYLERIWAQCFKVLDDIKETVRVAAATLARTLTGILTRTLEADTSASKNATAMLKHVLPFLLSTSGLESSAQEVQAFALQTLLEIIKKSNGKTLRPFIPELVERLLGLLSSLEPQAVNYIHLNADKYDLTEQKIDDMRLSSVRSSPLMEAIERCLDLLDEATMSELRPRLETAMKNAVGLPSKVGCSRTLVSLSTRHNVLFRPHSDHFLKVIEKHVLDRNETVSSSYAAAAGYVARGATDKQILRLGAFAKRLYFESEGDREQVVPRRSVAAGDIIHAIAKHATDRFNSLAADLLPFVFVGKHDTNEHVKVLFQETWADNVGGPRAVALYLKEILIMAEAHVDSPQWALKHTAARSIADATESVASMNNEMDVAIAQIVWPALEKALGGKTWDGKQEVLHAFSRFVETSGRYWQANVTVAQAMQKIMIREAKRQNPAYRPHALRCLGRFARARTDLDLSNDVREIVSAVFSDMVKIDGEDAMEVDGDEGGSKSKKLREETLISGVEALSTSVNAQLSHGSGTSGKLLRVLETVDSVQTLVPQYAGVRLAVGRMLDDLSRIFHEEKVSSGDVPSTSERDCVLTAIEERRGYWLQR